MKDNEVVLSTVFQIQIFYLRYIFENFNIGAILKYKIVEIVKRHEPLSCMTDVL